MYVSKFFHLICVLNIVIIYQFLPFHKRFNLVESHEYQIYIENSFTLYPNGFKQITLLSPLHCR